MKDPSQEVMQLRGQGLTDSVIMEELTKKGYSADNVNAAISGLDAGVDPSGGPMPGAPMPGGMPSAPMPGGAMPAPMTGSPMPSRHGVHHGGVPMDSSGNIYERIEEITESMIDEKWDELIVEVKKIVEWKAKIEEVQTRINSDLQKLKEDFKTLHQGVLGKMEDYDKKMTDVGTELHAVGKVFKDVVPQFVENVKELGHLTGNLKK